MTIEGYHVSSYKYFDGNKICIKLGQTTHFHDALVKNDNTAAEDRLKVHKPIHAPCRTNCLYVFGDLSHCTIYGDSQHKCKKVYYYRVRMAKAMKVPMKLVDYIRKQTAPSDAQVKQMVKEYWEPTSPWRYWEYLTDEFEIVKEVEPLNMGSREVIIAVSEFQCDDTIAKEFCATVMNPKAT